ncbi:RHS repeat-associated core domain-containing protein [Lentisphaerota bacterium WC36G]|nr:RHS repeat-associated core domain-containing protein [Lentisphaerae bacterium WC36]
MALEKDGVVFNYIADGNKNITQLIDMSSGSVANRYDYSPFGQLIADVETVENPFKFSSEYAEKETGLIYYNYRYYNPSTGKWINRDPIQEKGGINLYGFALNSAINYWDNLGLTSSTYIPGIGNRPTSQLGPDKPKPRTHCRDCEKEYGNCRKVAKIKYKAALKTDESFLRMEYDETMEREKKIRDNAIKWQLKKLNKAIALCKNKHSKKNLSAQLLQDQCIDSAKIIFDNFVGVQNNIYYAARTAARAAFREGLDKLQKLRLFEFMSDLDDCRVKRNRCLSTRRLDCDKNDDCENKEEN